MTMDQATKDFCSDAVNYPGSRLFVMTVGLPGSGKTTFIRDTFGSMPMPVTILSTDDIVDSITCKYGMTYNDGWKDLIKFATKVFNDKIGHAIFDNKHFIIDRTNLTLKSRLSILNDLPSNYKKLCLYFDTPINIIDQRLKQRPGKTIPPDVISDMVRRFAKPDIYEGFDMISTIKYKDDGHVS